MALMNGPRSGFSFTGNFGEKALGRKRGPACRESARRPSVVKVVGEHYLHRLNTKEVCMVRNNLRVSQDLIRKSPSRGGVKGFEGLEDLGAHGLRGEAMPLRNLGSA